MRIAIAVLLIIIGLLVFVAATLKLVFGIHLQIEIFGEIPSTSKLLVIILISGIAIILGLKLAGVFSKSSKGKRK